jgi:hypothetical protein
MRLMDERDATQAVLERGFAEIGCRKRDACVNGYSALPDAQCAPYTKECFHPAACSYAFEISLFYHAVDALVAVDDLRHTKICS